MNEGSASSFEVNATVPHNCGRALVELHIPNEFLTATNPQLCVNQIPVNDAGTEPKADLVGMMQKRNLFKIEYSAASSTIVHAVIGGGKSQLKLGSCV